MTLLTAKGAEKSKEVLIIKILCGLAPWQGLNSVMP